MIVHGYHVPLSREDECELIGEMKKLWAAERRQFIKNQDTALARTRARLAVISEIAEADLKARSEAAS